MHRPLASQLPVTQELILICRIPGDRFRSRVPPPMPRVASECLSRFAELTSMRSRRACGAQTPAGGAARRPRPPKKGGCKAKTHRAAGGIRSKTNLGGSDLHQADLRLTTSSWGRGGRGRRRHLAHGPQALNSHEAPNQNPHGAHTDTEQGCYRSRLEMLGYYQPRDSHAHGGTLGAHWATDQVTRHRGGGRVGPTRRWEAESPSE